MCSKKCGGGISYRKRKCIPSKCPYADPLYNKCDGTDYQEKKCNEHCCPGMLHYLILHMIPYCAPLNRKTILGFMGEMGCV